MKFRKKPIVIEAVQWTGNNTVEIETFVGQKLTKQMDFKNEKIAVLWIPTLESPHEATPGDWIIKGIKKEFYPCKPDIFEQTYEEAT